MKKKLLFRFTVPFILIVLLLIVVIGISSKNTDINSQSGWVLQTNLQSQLRGRTINDMTFIDSVTGFAVTNGLSQTDTCFVFKTTNGGDNWFVNYWTNEQYSNAFYQIFFPDSNIGYICGGGGIALICKTTDRGNTWVKTNYMTTLRFKGMSCINKDTVYVINDENLTGGIFRTTNGGANWQNIYAAGQYNPYNIYMYNARIGFYSDDSRTWKTSDGGFNWTQINNKGYRDIHFLDSIVGYRISDSNGFGRIQKTLNGGINWTQQTTPNLPGGSTWNDLLKFYFINNDTIFAVGSVIEYINPLRDRGIINKTTNGGLNWGYQLPDTHTVLSFRYYHVYFKENKYGWAYMTNGYGVRTTSGGDTTYYTGINNQTTNITTDFVLYQNYPNPFNTSTKIKIQMLNQGSAEIKIFDITGKLIKVFVNQNLNSGEHTFMFNAENFASGIYFYALYINENLIDTKKLILLK
ncbi:MAG: T9SS type A sorting domain-containing protein [Ignavibacteriae bacterium]|nr:T9SS type A sorting domain-containing protein [Ignavibacteriota bacterium]